ncbi:Maf family protein [Porticoccus sp.]
MTVVDSREQFILASASPRRRELLEQIGCRFRVAPVDLDETPLKGESPAAYVVRLAQQKASAGWQRNGQRGLPVLGADTAVVLGERIFGKPTGRDDAVAMLQSLSGNTHRVLSAVAMTDGAHCLHRLSETLVSFRPLEVGECLRYWDSGEPADKAGAYAIQGYGAVFVTAIRGSYSGVVGLPLVETCELLKAFGLSWWMEKA